MNQSSPNMGSTTAMQGHSDTGSALGVWREVKEAGVSVRRTQGRGAVHSHRDLEVCTVRMHAAPRHGSTNFTPAMALLTLCFHLFVDSSGTCRRF